MKGNGFFSSPKRVILFIAFILMCILSAIGGVTMALSMNGVIQ